jgi:chemotaxis protein MotA
MLFIIGSLVVFSCVLGAHSVHGSMAILFQPLEFVIIVGAAIGAAIVSNSADSLKDSLKALKYIFKGKPYKKTDYLELLKFFYNTFKLMKTKGMLEIESHIENPQESNLFQVAPTLLKDRHNLDFICDYLRILTMGIDNPHHFEDLIDKEIDLYIHEKSIPGTFWTQFGESLPALGIVAAVLGVINTMQSISEPPEVLGNLIGAALVGTFAGILLSYGIFSPIGSFVTKYGSAQAEYLVCIKSAFVSHLHGNAPSVTTEFIRKIIPEHDRPSFKELEDALSGEPAAAGGSK